MSGQNGTAASDVIAAARMTLKIVFGIDAEDDDAAWFAEEQQRSSRILCQALAGGSSLFDIRARRFDELLQGKQDDQSA